MALARLTSRGTAPRLPRVRRLRHRLAAVFLVAFWLLATQHCGLEAAGVFEAHAVAASGCCTNDGAHCSHDGCQIVEGRSLNTVGVVNAPQPQLTLCTCLICLTVPTPEPERILRVGMDDVGRPLHWGASWKFVQRVVPSPRAPSLV